MRKRYQFWMGIAALALAVVLQGADVHAGTTGKIQGVVRDAATGEALPGANVVLDGTRRGATTDVNGYYTILLVDPGAYSMSASMIGYDSQRKTDVRVQSDFTSDVNFLIRESALELGEMVVVAERPPVEPDRTTSKYIVGADDIENIPMVRSASEFIELQAGVSVEGDVSIRAGDAEDTAYYVDGVRIQSTDAAGSNSSAYRDVNRSSIQEMTVVTGGMAAEYGNAQGGVVSFVTREGGQDYHGMFDYQFQPSGQKHWGESVYDSAIHRGNNQWDNSDWVGETITLLDGTTAPAHQRRDYTGEVGHFVEGNLSGPVSEGLTFFVSSKWRKEASVFPGAYLTTPFNTNTNLKLSYSASPTLKVRTGGFYDKRKGNFRGPNEGGLRDMRDKGKNVFMATAIPAGERFDSDYLLWASATHSISPKTFYEVRLSYSVSNRDTVDLVTGGGATPEKAVTGNILKDAAGYYSIDRAVTDWELFSRKRLSLKADLSSQVNKQNFVKAGVEVTRFNNWWQFYESSGPANRRVRWYSKTYEDIDFFPGQETKGVNPLQAGVYIQDKVEFEGMIVNAGIRADAFWVKEMTTDVDAFYGMRSPMWTSMTRNRNVPTVDPTRIGAISPRVGISHPITSKSLIRFFYGKFTQLPSFQMLYRNEWHSTVANDRDLNGNGLIDNTERWNAFDQGGNHHNVHLPPEETVNFELGVDWNFVSNYVLGATTYYKSAGHQLKTASQQWRDPSAPGFVQGQSGWAFGNYRDTRGFEFSIRKQFSDYFAFNVAYNLQWADQGSNSAHRRDVFPDSIFVANGHYWLEYTVDPSTNTEVPVPLSAADREKFGDAANDAIRSTDNGIVRNTAPGNAWIPWLSHYASDGWPQADKTYSAADYGSDDTAFWERVNSDPNYPGTGEGNLIVWHNQETGERTPLDRDRRAFGSMTFLLATPADFGPWNGQALGNVRGNLVYRVFTGTRFPFTGLAKGISSFEYGPMHTRTDLNAEKQVGSGNSNVQLTLAVEVYNLFNQKDTRQDVATRGFADDLALDIDEIRWQTYGITGPEPTSPDYVQYGEINDIANYMDQPRALNFSLRLKW